MRSGRLSRSILAIPLVLAVAAAGGAVTGCGAGGAASSGAEAGAENGRLTVFAAASLTGAFTVLGRTFEQSHRGVKVTFNFGSSATLAQQIVEGAPADVFAAASPATMTVVTRARQAARPHRLRPQHNDYPIATLSAAPSARLAEQFVALVLSPRGARVLTGAGFQAGAG